MGFQSFMYFTSTLPDDICSKIVNLEIMRTNIYLQSKYFNIINYLYLGSDISTVLSAYLNKAKCFFEEQSIFTSDIQVFNFLLFLSNSL